MRRWQHGVLTAAVVVAHASAALGDSGFARPKNNVTASVVDYGATATYARIVFGRLSAGISGTYLPPGIEDYSLLGAGLHLRYHVKPALNPRFVAEINIRGFRVFDIELLDNIGVFGGSDELHTTALVAGGWIGWRWFWRNGLNVGIGAGLDYPFASWGRCVSVCVLAKRRLDARPFLDVGYAF